MIGFGRFSRASPIKPLQGLPQRTSLTGIGGPLRWHERSALLASVLTISLVPIALQAQAVGKVGEVGFPVSCSAEAQQQFTRAVALLHSFWYEEAVKAFTGVAETDPSCAMAYWGVAMSNWYPLWYPPSAAALKAGSDAVAKAQSIGAKTDRERDYIDAI